MVEEPRVKKLLRRNENYAKFKFEIGVAERLDDLAKKRLLIPSILFLDIWFFLVAAARETPTHLDWFGWCTWDAFYSEVNPNGILEGLNCFSKGECAPKFLIVDDGWQDTVNEFQKEGEPFIEGTQFATRLVDIKENSKFKSFGTDGSRTNLRDFIGTIKAK